MDAASGKKILRVLSSENARKILEVTGKKQITASQISIDCKIPLTKVYQWIKKLQELNLLKISNVITERRKIRLYQNLIKMIVINPNEYPSIKIEVLGIGIRHKCDVCGSSNFTLTYYTKPNKMEYRCIDCELEHANTAARLLKEERQKVVFLKFIQSKKKDNS